MNRPDHSHAARQATHFDERCEPLRREVEAHPERLRQRAMPFRMWSSYRYAVELIGSGNGRRLLDLGCGTGEWAVYFAQQGFHVLGVDVSPVSVEVARRRAVVNDVEAHVEVLLGSNDDIAADAGSIDVAFGSAVVHHMTLEQLRRMMASLHRLLRADGLAIFIEPVENTPWLSRLEHLLPAGTRRGATHYHLDYRPSCWSSAYQAWKRDEDALGGTTLTDRLLRDLGAPHFQRIIMAHFGLVNRLDVFLAGESTWIPRLKRGLDRFDDRLLSLCPWLKRFARNVVVCYRDPHPRAAKGRCARS